MISEFCLDVNSVGIQIGQDLDGSSIRICLPYMNVGMYIGNEVPFTWPPEYLRHSHTGEVLLNDDGTPLIAS